MSEQEQRSRRLAMHLEEDEYSDDEGSVRYPLATTEQPIFLNTDGHCERLVLMSVLAPIGHTYLTVAETLLSLLGNVMPESEFIRNCVSCIQNKFDSNHCRYGKICAALFEYPN